MVEELCECLHELRYGSPNAVHLEDQHSLNQRRLSEGIACSMLSSEDSYVGTDRASSPSIRSQSWASETIGPTVLTRNKLDDLRLGVQELRHASPRKTQGLLEALLCDEKKLVDQLEHKSATFLEDPVPPKFRLQHEGRTELYFESSVKMNKQWKEMLADEKKAEDVWQRRTRGEMRFFTDRGSMCSASSADSVVSAVVRWPTEDESCGASADSGEIAVSRPTPALSRCATGQVWSEGEPKDGLRTNQWLKEQHLEEQRAHQRWIRQTSRRSSPGGRRRSRTMSDYSQDTVVVPHHSEARKTERVVQALSTMSPQELDKVIAALGTNVGTKRK